MTAASAAWRLSDCLEPLVIRHHFSQVHRGDLKVQRQIGEGSFGRVYLARWNETTVAVKMLLSTFTSSGMGEEQEAMNAHTLEQLDMVR